MNYWKQSITTLFLVSIFNFALLTFNLRLAEAQTMSNFNFKLKSNILFTPDKYSNNKTGIDNNESGIKLSSLALPLIFSISQNLIGYGILSPTTPVARTNLLTVKNNYLFGYNAIAFEDHSLYNQTSSSTIPDTTCDTGTCSEKNSGLWNSILTYGFGYRCDNMSDTNGCSNDFLDSNYYKHFSNISNLQSPQVVMSGASISENKSRITYKVNVSTTQPSGFYSNTITFVATANF